MRLQTSCLVLLAVVPLFGDRFPSAAIAMEPPAEKQKKSTTKSVARLEKDIKYLKAEVRKLRRQVRSLNRRGSTLVSQDGTVIEYGSIIFEKGRKYHTRKIRFSNEYESPPLVIVCESGTAGSWVMVKSQGITTTGAEIAVQNKFQYRCRVGYIVVGDGRHGGSTKVVRKAGRDSKPKNEPKGKRKPNPIAKPITWRKYMTDCGKRAQEINEARTEEVFRNRYHGKTVTWEGKVQSVTETLFGGSYLVMVKMSPSESLSSDVTLSVSKQFKQVVLSLNEGSRIRFTGVIDGQGGAFIDHSIKVVAFDKKK